MSIWRLQFNVSVNEVPTAVGRLKQSHELQQIASLRSLWHLKIEVFYNGPFFLYNF